MEALDLQEALETLGEILSSRGHNYDVVLIGGGALLLLGLIDRPTRDLDIVSRIEGGRWLEGEPMPIPLAQAIADVARALDLDGEWLNAGPTSLLRLGLPSGFSSRAELLDAARWCRTHDTPAAFRQILIEALTALGVEEPDV